MVNCDSVEWLVLKIQECKNKKWRTSRKEIFQGCYDVFTNQSDQIKYLNIMNNRLNELITLGLATIDESKNYNLTESGIKMLSDCV